MITNPVFITGGNDLNGLYVGKGKSTSVVSLGFLYSHNQKTAEKPIKV